MSVLISKATGKLTFKTANPLGVVYDPIDFVVTLRDPKDLIGAGQVYVYDSVNPGTSSIQRLSAGEFLLRVPNMIPGRWHWSARGVDTGDANRVDVTEGSFQVQHSRVVTNV